MNSRLAGAASILTLMILSGCATMSGDECATSDWYAIGFEDGSRGYTSSRLGDHRKACAKHGVTPDFEAYQTGRNEGLVEFCQPSRGFNLGASGSQYHGVCSAHREGQFLDAYNSGYHLYNLRSNVNSATYRINANKQEQEETQRLIRDKEAALIAKDTPTEERIILIADLKDLSERSGQLESEMYQLIEDRAMYEQQLQSYEAVLADSGY
ncbi:MAG: DUF2799 domain-containing protein [Gammaproteobacteria bacterium]|nr:DUF2799 domain-containing protein [Gammaproteobacteria bacterium]MDH4315115.1 DUF2799 domain-containing protein [Gammaproteobacteria bacterium]MDH5214262.1 DUF2799 domain-containing protein [Gammaproteobacteria bacterium]MDH5500640.1 DUF2799 domain-containing protein [Gammaproteobacteria bacterium]